MKNKKIFLIFPLFIILLIFIILFSGPLCYNFYPTEHFYHSTVPISVNVVRIPQNIIFSCKIVSDEDKAEEENVYVSPNTLTEITNILNGLELAEVTKNKNAYKKLAKAQENDDILQIYADYGSETVSLEFADKYIIMNYAGVSDIPYTVYYIKNIDEKNPPKTQILNLIKETIAKE